MNDPFVIYLSLWVGGCIIEALATLAVVIPFPAHRIRRARRIADVFAPFRDAVELERIQTRFLCVCTAVTTFLSVALELSIG